MTLTGTSLEPPADLDGPLDGLDEEVAKKIQGRSTWQLACSRLKRDRASMISFAVIVVIILVAVFAPAFSWILFAVSCITWDICMILEAISAVVAVSSSEAMAI